MNNIKYVGDDDLWEDGDGLIRMRAGRAVVWIVVTVGGRTSPVIEEFWIKAEEKLFEDLSPLVRHEQKQRKDTERQ